MAATQTVPQDLQHCNSVPIIPRHGVVTLFGYGINVHVDRGHLSVRDGIGPNRRSARFARVGHGLKRLVIVGSDGIVSFSALRWLADQNATFAMLDRDGTVLITTGPVRSSDARLRRTQALAHHSGVALHIARELILKKLAAQESVCRNRIHNIDSADAIVDASKKIPKAKTVSQLRLAEAQAGAAYWSAWHGLPISYPRADLIRVPEHWRTFGGRKSPISGSPRLAVNPPNAMLNYLYAILESESRLALAALGLDPGTGVLHADLTARDSLACDVMEPVRPQVDRYLLEWIQSNPLRREWFFEERNGNCRLMGSFAARLTETASTWARAVAPHAEWIAQTLWSSMSRPAWDTSPATRLTHRRRLEARGKAPSEGGTSPRPPMVCRICGTVIKSGDKYCVGCKPIVSRENMIEAAKLGRVATVSPAAQKRRADSQRRQSAALRSWNPSDKPEWLDESTYRERVQPRLAGITVRTIMSALAVSEPYATNIRAGRCTPHPRHWMTLARLIGVHQLELRSS
jgi:CRISPR-associated endonuclease Cas1